MVRVTVAVVSVLVLLEVKDEGKEYFKKLMTGLMVFALFNRNSKAGVQMVHLLHDVLDQFPVLERYDNGIMHW